MDSMFFPIHSFVLMMNGSLSSFLWQTYQTWSYAVHHSRWPPHWRAWLICLWDFITFFLSLAVLSSNVSHSFVLEIDISWCVVEYSSTRNAWLIRMHLNWWNQRGVPIWPLRRDQSVMTFTYRLIIHSCHPCLVHVCSASSLESDGLWLLVIWVWCWVYDSVS